MGLSTGVGARWPESGFSRPIFSAPHDCLNLVNSLQIVVFERFLQFVTEHFDTGGVSEV